MFYSQINLQSDLSQIGELDSFLESVMQQCGIREDFLGLMSVPLNECVENAIVHGNKCDSSKKVLVEVQLKQSKLLFSITDEGSGFDYDYFLQQDIEQAQKKGLLTVKMLTENLDFAKNGSQVIYALDVPFSVSAADRRADILQQSKQAAEENAYRKM
ncbi:MAG: ATP-binding protein [Bacteroidales bacterium]|jgi:serine/threonine-protein kinase RsbW|nr:ATP-binding protein [Bacteroidales bacterium]